MLIHKETSENLWNSLTSLKCLISLHFEAGFLILQNVNKTELLCIWFLPFKNSVCHTSNISVQFSCVKLYATPLTAARQPSLSITNSWSLLKLMSIESVMPSKHLILCLPIVRRLQFSTASGSFLMSQFFISIGQSIGVSASASVLPMNIQNDFL